MIENKEREFTAIFFEALKYKAIGQHEKALDCLEKCLKMKPKEAILYVETGKNHMALENYVQAEQNFLKALELHSPMPYVRLALLDTYALLKDYPKAIEEAKQLLSFNSEIYKRLVNLYMLNQQPKAALHTLTTYASMVGFTPYIRTQREAIFNHVGATPLQINYWKKQVKNSPDQPENYVHLIHLYAVNKETQKAFVWAKRMEEKFPASEQLQRSLYPLYLQTGQIKKAVSSLKIVVASKKISPKTKVKCLQAFIRYVKEHPEHQSTLIALLDYAKSTGEALASAKDLGDFYAEKNKAAALAHYEKALAINFNDLPTIEQALALQIRLKKYKAALALSKKALEVFPSQAKLYLTQGKIYNRLQKYSLAIARLDIANSLILGSLSLKVVLFEEQAKAHRGLGENAKAVEFETKASHLKQKM